MGASQNNDFGVSINLQLFQKSVFTDKGLVIQEEEVVFIATSTKGRSGWGHHPYTQKYKLFFSILT